MKIEYMKLEVRPSMMREDYIDLIFTVHPRGKAAYNVMETHTRDDFTTMFDYLFGILRDRMKQYLEDQ